jgi:hypothetical protein
LSVNPGVLFSSDPSSSSGSAPAIKGYYNAYFIGSGSNYWTTTSTTYADFTATGTLPAPTVLQSSGFATIGGAASSLPGIKLTAPNTGLLRVTALCNLLLADGGFTSGVQLFEGTSSTVLDLWGSFDNVSLGTDQFQVTLVGYFSVTVGTVYTFKIQGKVSANTLFLGGETTDNCLGFKIEYIE